MQVVTVGEQIKKIRTQKGMTQKQVADACGMADSAIRKYESGIMRPKPFTVSRIAKALGVEPLELTSHDPNYPITFTVPIDELPEAIHYMFSGNTEQKKPTPVSEDGLDAEQSEIVRLYKAAPPALRAAALAVLRSAEGQGKAPGGVSTAE